MRGFGAIYLFIYSSSCCFSCLTLFKMFSIFGFQSFLFPFGFEMPQRRYFWYFSCFLFSELPRSMVKCLYLTWKNSQFFFLQILASIFLLLIEAYLCLVPVHTHHRCSCLYILRQTSLAVSFSQQCIRSSCHSCNCHSIFVVVILANVLI